MSEHNHMTRDIRPGCPACEPHLPAEFPEPEEPPVKATWVDLTISGDRYSLNERDVFPDGVPNPSGFWSAETLAIALGLEYSNPMDMLRDWNLTDELVIQLRDSQGRRATINFGGR